MPQYKQLTAEEIRDVVEDKLAPRVDGLGFHVESFTDAVRIHLALGRMRADDDALHEAIMATVSELLHEVVHLDPDSAPDSPDERRPRRPRRQDHQGRYTMRFARRFVRH